jgi:hypothetical protein
MNVIVVNFFGIFFLGLKHVLKQVRLKLLTSFAKIWKCEALGCAKIAGSLPPSLLLRMHSVPIDPMAFLQNGKRLGFQHSTTSLVALLYLSLCFNASTHAKKKVFCSHAHKQALTIENEKKGKLLSEQSFQAQNIVSTGTNSRPNSFDLEFWSKIEFGTMFNPCVIFRTKSQVSSPVPAKLKVLVPTFNNFNRLCSTKFIG